MIEFRLSEEWIELYKLLKATTLCGSGGEAKRLISEGLASVDGEVETRKRCKIRAEQVVGFGGEEIRVFEKAL